MSNQTYHAFKRTDYLGKGTVVELAESLPFSESTLRTAVSKTRLAPNVKAISLYPVWEPKEREIQMNHHLTCRVCNSPIQRESAVDEYNLSCDTCSYIETYDHGWYNLFYEDLRCGWAYDWDAVAVERDVDRFVQKAKQHYFEMEE